MGMRPKGKFGPWASNVANYTGFPGKPYNNQPRIVEPASGIIADGFTPEKPLPAERLNWKLNRSDLFSDYLDAIEVQNFRNRTDISGVSGTGYILRDGLYDEVASRYFVLSDDDSTNTRIVMSNGELDWTLDETNLFGSSRMRSIANRESDGFIWVVGRTDAHWRNAGTGAWTSGTIPNTTDLFKVVYDKQDDVFWMGGIFSGNGILFQAGTTIGSVTSTTLTTPAAGTVDMIATNDSKKICILRHATTSYLWSGTTVGSWARTTPTFTGDDPSALLWSDDLDVFVVTTANGKTYTSPDGVTWTLMSTQAGWDFADQGLIARGGILLAAVTVNSLLRYAYSLDMGATWTLFLPPSASFGFFGKGDGCIFVGENVSHIQYGLRLK